MSGARLLQGLAEGVQRDGGQIRVVWCRLFPWALHAYKVGPRIAPDRRSILCLSAGAGKIHRINQGVVIGDHHAVRLLNCRLDFLLQLLCLGAKPFFSGCFIQIGLAAG